MNTFTMNILPWINETACFSPHDGIPANKNMFEEHFANIQVLWTFFYNLKKKKKIFLVM